MTDSAGGDTIAVAGTLKGDVVTYGQALVSMINGARVHRPAWGKQCWAAYSKSGTCEIAPPHAEHFNDTLTLKMGPSFVAQAAGGGMITFKPTDIDQLADDWLVFK
jgi:Protein of unknown function (DUF2829)